MFYYLYQIKNNLDSKIYVGVHQTKKLDDGYMGSGKVIRSAIHKHGVENFTKVILETFENAEAMYAKEAEIVDLEFLKRPDVYNICCGGSGGWDYLNNDSNLQRDKGSRGNIKMKFLRSTNPEWVKKKWLSQSIALKLAYKTGNKISLGWSESAIKKAWSDEAREKRNQTFKEIKCQQGENNSQWGVKRISLYKEGIVKRIKVEEIEIYLLNGWMVNSEVQLKNKETARNLKLTEKELKSQKIKLKILNSSVDFSSKKWALILAEELGSSRNNIKNFIKSKMPDLWVKCFIDKGMCRNNNKPILS